MLGTLDREICLSGEWIGREPGWREHLPRELATLRSYA